MPSTIIESVQLALRTKSTAIVPEIGEYVAQAQAELIRSGVSEDVVNASGELVNGAIKMYCISKMASDERQRVKAEESWLYQQDCLRKTYRGVSDV